MLHNERQLRQVKIDRPEILFRTDLYYATISLLYDFSQSVMILLIHENATRRYITSLHAAACSLELCAAAPPPPTECRRRAGAVFVKCSRHVVQQLYVARFL